METFEEMEDEDGYMMLNCKNNFKYRQKTKVQVKKLDSSQNINISTLAGNNYMCPNHWLLNQGKCYKFLISSKTWNESQHDCINLQAHLLMIHNSEELEFIQKSLKPGRLARIGLSMISPRKQWMWINEHLFVEQKIEAFLTMFLCEQHKVNVLKILKCSTRLHVLLRALVFFTCYSTEHLSCGKLGAKKSME
ncbi:killer cell lectin-like receptor subfamily F member 2 [Pteropus vampyrus]|uniref:Killer cell lectin-like receptor subfamily F member 2 n=1 Tax=Pteropus vampyrus TaxID=132908 RepID=A0A6P6CQI7_PTEVA|nr:killer cell lectin-like receptor subfamily F member 2 [Pteropus vampyrus]